MELQHTYDRAIEVFLKESRRTCFQASRCSGGGRVGGRERFIFERFCHFILLVFDFCHSCANMSN